MRGAITLEDGCQIEYLEDGAGEPMVYLHGAGGVFPKARFAPELGTTFRVFSPSRPGYDGSTGLSESAREDADADGAKPVRQLCLIRHAIRNAGITDLSFRSDQPLRHRRV